jgi:hypothetical protein
MSWQSTLTDVLAVLLLCLGLVGGGAARAQSIESAIMPGQLILGHAKLEDRCEICHVRFDRDAQPRLCLDCHKTVAADVLARQGFHGRLKERNCRDCHSDHKGRAAKIVSLDEKRFDHAQTDFQLRGAHAGKACGACHAAGVKQRKAPSECVACHRKQDKHKGGLGNQCGNCHDEKTWKEARFDHGKTRFALLSAHGDLACEKCHAGQRYANTPRECLSCHRKDDAHKGSFGPRCETCHKETKWNQPSFRHDVDTRFRLLDRHRTLRCSSCHSSPLYRQKTPTRCVECHRNDDAHKHSLGDKCETCHNEKSWKEARFDHGRSTRFSLRDRHATARCDACHKAAGPREKLPLQCNGCHAEDDQKKGHKGRFGVKCESCHNEKAFRPSVFAHDRDTRFVLRERHRQARCESCHKGASLQDKLGNTCFSCHERDDAEKGHKGRYGVKCESCHSEKAFKPSLFDHDRNTRYPLTGRHRPARCEACHKEALGAARLEQRCIACHKDDDVHFASLGPVCDQCHVTELWRKVIKREGTR